MRLAYSLLREIHLKNYVPEATNYGLKEVEFEQFIKLMENKGYLERVLRVGDQYWYSIKNARITKSGLALLEEYKHYEEEYPERDQLKDWVKLDRYQERSHD